MTDQERILKLLEDGKISREEAEGLLEALDATESMSVEGNLALKRDALAADRDRLLAANDELLAKLERLATLKERGIRAELIDELVKARNVDETLLKKLERIATLKERGIDIEDKELLELDRGRYGEIVYGSVVVSKELRDEIAKKPLEIDPSVISRIPPIPPVPPIPPIPPVPPIPPLAPTFPFTSTDDLPKDMRWVRVNMMSGAVAIAVNPSLKSLRVEADEGADVEQDEDGNWTVTAKNDDFELTIPEGFGVMLDVKSADVEAHVPVLRGSVMSGDVSLEDVESLNLVVMSGDVNAELKLQKGKHKLHVSSGDVSLTFQEGSSLSYGGSVYSGDVNVEYPEGDFNRTNTSFEGKVGEGAAQLSLEVQSGDLNIEIEDEDSSIASTAKTSAKKSKSDKNFEFNFDFDFAGKSVKEPSNTRWLAIRALSGNVSLKTEPGLKEPKIIEGSQLKKKDNGELGMYRLMGDVEVVLPEDYGVRLDVVAGNLEAHDVAYLKGRVWAGNAELSMVRGVNLVVMAGNAEAELFLTENEHSLDVWSGNADVELVGGSSVTATGVVLTGDVDVRVTNAKHEIIDNRKFKVIMGDGTAQFNLSVKAGNLDFEANND